MSIKRMNAVWELSQHKGSALLQLLAIADNADDLGVAWPGLAYIARKTRMSRRQVIRVNEICTESGELWILNRSQTSNLYIVTPGLTGEDLEQAMDRAAKLGAIIPTGSDKLSPPPQVLVVTKCHLDSDKMSPPGDKMTRGSDIAASLGSDIAMSPDPSLTIITPEKEDLWKTIKEALRTQMGKATFDLWLDRAQLIDASNGQWTVQVAHPNAVTWLENRLATTIERTMDHFAPGVELRFTVAES